ncbi:MAG: hypothetical protein U5K28_02830 [Halobacteriales archaeon]|nr:hypothetical protein [Halobacteriales archaeon]
MSYGSKSTVPDTVQHENRVRVSLGDRFHIDLHRTVRRRTPRRRTRRPPRAGACACSSTRRRSAGARRYSTDQSRQGCDTDSEADKADNEANDADIPDLDLREANVVEVAFEATDEGYAFDVSLHHDDDGEEGYANWWQVERLDGTRLGRESCCTPSSEQPFTRSETVEIPDDVSCVVVRGHDQMREYGGVAAVVDIGDAAVRRVDQGSDPRSFDASDCP